MKTVLLGDVADIKGGGTPPTGKSEYFDGPLPWFTPTEIIAGKISFLADSVRTLTDEGAMFTAVAEPGTVLLTSRAGIGKVGVLQNRAGYNQGIKGFKPKDNKLDSLYLAHWLLFNKELLEEKANGTTFLEISSTTLKNLEIPCPDIEEQRRIVKKLDEAFEKIDKAKENTEKNLKNTQELFDSELNKVFTKNHPSWTNSKISKIAKIQYGYTEKASVDEVGPKFLRITDIQNGQVLWQNVPYCKCEEDFEKFRLKDGDLVFARTGATTGKSYLIKNPPQAVFASYLIRIQLQNSQDVIPEFLALFFQTKAYWDLVNQGTSGSAQGGFNATKLGELNFVYPTKSEQAKIVEKLDKVSEQTQKLQKLYQHKLDNLEELKKSILKQAFEGKL